MPSRLAVADRARGARVAVGVRDAAGRSTSRSRPAFFRARARGAGRLALAGADRTSDHASRTPGAPRSRAAGGGWRCSSRTEATLFGTLVGTYVYLRAQARRLAAAGHARAATALWPLVLTARARRDDVPLRGRSRRGARGRVARGAARLLASRSRPGGYLARAARAVRARPRPLPAGGSAYASIYFTLLGAHAAHVAAGMLLELWVLARLVGGLTRYRLVALQVTVFYWVFVNVLAVIVVAVQLSPRL